MRSARLSLLSGILCLVFLLSGCSKETEVDVDTKISARQEFAVNLDNFRVFLQTAESDIETLAHKGLAIGLNDISISVSDTAMGETLPEPVVLDDLTLLVDKCGYNTYAELYTLCREYSYSEGRMLLLKMQFSLEESTFTVSSCMRTLISPETLVPDSTGSSGTSGSSFEPPSNDPWIVPGSDDEPRQPWIPNDPDYTFSEPSESDTSSNNEGTVDNTSSEVDPSSEIASAEETSAEETSGTTSEFNSDFTEGSYES